jgi:transcriptional regulator with XRE-family HTH domain
MDTGIPGSGDRVREARKRAGMSQHELASAAGLSKDAIASVEQGRLPLRAAAAQKIAAALTAAGTTTTTTGLIAPPAQEPEVASGTGIWAATRDALLAPPASAHGDGSGAVLDEAIRLYHRNAYDDLSRLLPVLIAGSAESPPLLRSRVMQLAGSMMVQVRQHDAARVALDASVSAAEAGGSEADAASAVVTRCWLLLAQGKFSEVRQVAARWSDRVEPRVSRASVSELSVWGWLLLRGSAAAVRDGDPGEAAEFMRLAHGAAALAGPEAKDPRWYWVTFGEATVAMKHAENELVAGHPDRVLDVARTVPAALSPTSDNRNRHLLDVAVALDQLRQRDKAIKVLTQIRTQAGPWLAEQKAARELIASISRRRRTLPPVLRELAGTVQA